MRFWIAAILIAAWVPVCLAQSSSSIVPGEIIVKYKSGSIGVAHGSSTMTLNAQSGPFAHYTLSAGADLAKTLSEIQQDPAVEYAEPNYYVRRMSDVNTSQSYSRAEVESIAANSSSYPMTGSTLRFQDVWSTMSSNGPDITVAILDSGADLEHEALAGALWKNPGEIPGNNKDDDQNGYVDDVNGWDFADGDGDPHDLDGHGTHVSGIIRGASQNIFDTPIADSHVRLMILKFLDRRGVGTTADAIKAVYYAVDMGAKVMNNSWGGGDYSRALHEAIAYAYQARVLFVAAAGNFSSNNDVTPTFPASYDVPNVIAVAASTDYDSLATFSNYGVSSVHIAAPGVSILSTFPGGQYTYLSGTSMAAPFASGISAMMIRENPRLPPHQIRSLLEKTSTSSKALSGRLASGRLDAVSAIVTAQTVTAETEQPDYQMRVNIHDRGLASEVAMGGGGCGTITGGDGRGGSGPSTTAILVFLLVPIALIAVLRDSDPNRRRFRRYKMPAFLKGIAGGAPIRGQLETISLGGLGFDARIKLGIGSRLTVTVTSPDGKESLMVTGRVVWVKHTHYGVEFEGLDADSASKIREWSKALIPA